MFETIAESKFILELDSSQLEEIMICPLSWFYKYYENLRSNMSRRKTAMNKGTIIHKLLEVFYKEMGKGTSRYKAAKFAQAKMTAEGWVGEYGLQEDAQFLKERFFNYVTHYDERDLELVKNEKGEAAAEIGFSKVLYEDDKCIYIVSGRFDGITQISVGRAWVDHKTQAKEMDLYPYN